VGRALAFGDSSIYALAQNTQTAQNAEPWSLKVLEEIAAPIAVYRLNDTGDVHARIDRIGAHCQLSTFRGSAHAFDPTLLASGPKIDCPESGSPVTVDLAVVFTGSSTGWSVSRDGLSLASLSPAEVKEALTHVRNDEYCALDGSKEDGTPVPYLDEVPKSVQCFWRQSGAPVGGTAQPTGPTPMK
jgi:hypothetical protein